MSIVGVFDNTATCIKELISLFGTSGWPDRVNLPDRQLYENHFLID